MILSTNNYIELKGEFFVEEELVTVFEDREEAYLNVDFDNNRLFPSEKGRLFYLGKKEVNEELIIDKYLIAYKEEYSAEMIIYKNSYEKAKEEFYLLLPDINVSETYMLIKVIEDEVVFIDVKY